MTECNADLLCLYLDGGLTLPGRVALEQHLSSCPKCADELEALQQVDNALGAWGQVRVPVPPATERRVSRSVARKRRLGPAAALARVIPAAVGSSIAALLVLVSVNLGVLYQNPSAPLASPGSQRSTVILKQSAPLSRVRRASAVMGYVVVPPRPTPQRRANMEVN